MSRHPQYEYEYPINHPQKIYIEEHEGFMADYSDSDCLPDSARQNLHTVPVPPLLSELYGRHSTIVPVKVVPLQKANNMVSKQQSEQFIRQSYYDRSVINASGMSSPQSCFPAIFDTAQNFYPTSTASQHDTNYGTKAFRSAYHNLDQFRQYDCQNCQSGQPKASNTKRFPVTVRTPKYYKKQPANSVFKRPSALCLPVAAQPDPAVMRRPRKPFFNENIFGMQETQGIGGISDSPSITLIKQICNQDCPHRVDSQGDNTSAKSTKLPPFDEILEQMEKGNLEAMSDVKPSEIPKISKYLKPRVPASVKAKQDKAKSKTTTEMRKPSVSKIKDQRDNKKSRNLKDVAQISLEKLLNQLKKCELATGKGDGTVDEEERRKQNNKSEKKENLDHFGEKSDITDDEKFDLPSFNYQDIGNHLFKSHSDLKCNSESATSIQDLTKKISHSASTTKHLPKKPLDDHCALELHKSKSYIVNLIDRALSRELGTVPCNRHRNEFENMNPKKAVAAVNRHLEKSDKELSVEITSALTDSLISNVTSPDIDDEPEEKFSKGKLCCCTTDEPIYIKQLKQLRWGHLKHIQREVKRLEDLERFLDSCSITTIPEM